MAIAQMTKLKLVGIGYEREKMLNALTDTGAVQIKCEEARFAASQEDLSVSALSEKIEKITQTIEFIEDCARKNSKDFSSSAQIRDIDFDKFLSVGKQAAQVDEAVFQIEAVKEELSLNKSQRTKLNTLLFQAAQYKSTDAAFSLVKNTKKVRFHLGMLSADAQTRLEAFVKQNCSCTQVEVCGTADNGLVVTFVAAHASENEQISDLLAQLNFVRCTISTDMTAHQYAQRIKESLATIDEKDACLTEKTLSLCERLDLMRLYCDMLRFERQKQSYAINFEKTAQTYTLEAYLPLEAKDFVTEKIAQTTDASYFCFEEILPEEDPPTLMQNNRVVRQFECITNMYSVPSYREFDPNSFVGIFFSIFFGFIMADIGYGVLLTVAGLLFASKMKRDTGMRRLLYVIGIGGIFTIIFGFLFGSFFGLTQTQPGFEWLPTPIIPDPIQSSQEVLMYALLGGAMHLMFGYIAKGLGCLQQKRVWDGIWDGFVWALFFVGLICLFPFGAQAFFNTSIFGIQNVPSWLNNVGFGICGSTLVVEVFVSGRHSKGFGKFTKGFGALYGLINIFSDLLSYARLFGLMLSGMMIANIVSTMSIPLLSSGVFGAVGAVIILLIGHTFNIAMGVLGAYIHDARLQFIEFFGKFYEGNGELFAPLGSNLEYTQIITSPIEKKQDLPDKGKQRA